MTSQHVFPIFGLPDMCSLFPAHRLSVSYEQLKGVCQNAT